ncbi:all-trans-retinol 13,14-reductase-like [Physella acuta]|uniref:all-trans-retinol 13,14-reductase-like n=1 Tax=Physella acuta TaxID=109671 RepID=UPI0027DB4204|nr:all-trans-retinol 13,14-reductase-like [Physella acuta]XP_059144384.1 all-trans-retinol 13,14-reductase-like [Physella acuta]XP_059144385.1 all-trans-retinol 13,14-reductase-like [Physella acuta]
MSIDIGLRSAIEYIVTRPAFLVAGFLFYVVLYLISVTFFGKKYGKNPFTKDYRRPPEPFVHDTKAREDVLKQRFKASLVPQNLDAIIIGSGVGGLSAGVLLSRAGCKVLVLEQHDQAGGCCHTFVEKGFEFDTGIHYIGNMHNGSVDRVLLDQVTGGQLRWAPMDNEFDQVAMGDPANAKLFKMKAGEKEYVQNLINLFPQEKDAILKYMELIKDASSSFYGIVMLKVLPKILVRFLVVTGLYKIVFRCYRKRYAEKTLQEFLDELTSNKELKLVLSYICGDYGIFPKDVPFFLHAILITHYQKGAYYPRAGTSEIPFHMIQSIEKEGGKVLVQAPVTKILCDEKGRAVGVRVGKNEMDVFARYIISDAGVVNTFKTLLPESVARSSCIYPLIEKVGPSCSFITAFIGVEGSPSELKLPAGNTWVYNTDDINKTMSEFLNLKADEMEDVQIPFGYISFPSAKDTEWEKKHPGKSSVLVITLANWDWFKEWKDEKLRHRGDRYEGIKDIIGRQLWQQCVDLFPQLDGKKVYMEVGTPVTNQYYLAAPQGEMYGLAQGKARFTADVASKLRPDTDIPGLFLTGQDTMTCGFTSALTMGLVCASQILNRNLYSDLLKIRKQVKKIDDLTKIKSD